MDHVALILSIFMVTLAGAGTAAALILHSRSHSRITLVVSVVAAAFLLALLTGVLSAYLLVVVPPEAYPSTFFAVAGTVLGVLVYSGLYALLRLVDPSRGWAHLAMLLVALAAQIGRAVVALTGTAELMEAIRLPALIAISVFLLYVGVIAVRGAAGISSATESSLMRRLGWLLVGFAPLSTLAYVLLDMIPGGYRLPVSLDFVFALLWSITLISVLVRYLGKPEAELEDGLSEGFRDAYGITDREAEVVALIAEGLSNKQIAERLFVSLATVRTHIYNVFRKTGAQSRVDLLRIVRRHRD